MTDPATDPFARTFSAPIGRWTTGVLREKTRPSERSAILRFEVKGRIDHLPGQHYVVRLRAEDGYTAQRSYSIVSDASDPLIELMVEKLPDGEVSPFLVDDMEVGDEVELRGPLGGFFVWDGSSTALAIGGGSGIVPGISMLRHAVAVGRSDLLTVVAAARTLADLPYHEELERFGATIALSRESYKNRDAGRLAVNDLDALGVLGDGGVESVFLCGSAVFAAGVGSALTAAGVPSAKIRVEKFGPTGA